MLDMENLDYDIAWIQRAMEEPYLNAKNDHSNMFELSCDDEGYVRYVIEDFQSKGYIVYRSGHFISLKK